jgi:hypothetical protein
VGGSRMTYLNTLPLGTLDEPTTVKIGGGRMILNAGLKAGWGMYLYYGLDAGGNLQPLNQDLRDYDKFRIDFECSDLPMGYFIQVADVNGNFAFAWGDTETAGQTAAFGDEIRKDEFQGAYGPLDWEHIDVIIVGFQNGSVIGGSDFAVTKIVAAKD